jgi:hypothetical protein
MWLRNLFAELVGVGVLDGPVGHRQQVGDVNVEHAGDADVAVLVYLHADPERLQDPSAVLGGEGMQV